jgi:ribosomal-protein-serine acetyltransferase
VTTPFRTELTAKNCRLRRFRPQDAPALFEAARASVKEVQLWLPWCHAAYTLAEAEGWVRHCETAWEKKEEFHFAVLDPAGYFMGGAGLNAVDWTNRRANLGYWIRSSHTGQGFATAATKLVAAFALDELKLQRVEIVAAVDNEASQKVATGAGAVQEGIARDRLLLHGKTHNAAVFSFVTRDRKKLPPLIYVEEKASPEETPSPRGRPPGPGRSSSLRPRGKRRPS